MKVIASPNNPMQVARGIMEDFTQDGEHTLAFRGGSWLRWGTTHWAIEDISDLKAHLYKAVEHVFYEKTTKDDVQIVQWEPTKHKIANLIDALQAVAGIRSNLRAPAWLVQTVQDQGTNIAEKWDPREIVSCANGLLHVPSRKIADHTPVFFNQVAVKFDYDHKAPEPVRWLEFLNSVWGDDQDQKDLLQEWMGYILSGRTDLQKIMMMIGPTRSGKGTISGVLHHLLGPENVSGTTLNQISNQFGRQDLIGKPLCITPDARVDSRARAVEALLSISGEDAQTIDRKYKEPWTGVLPTRLAIMSNEPPTLIDQSGAIVGRLLVLRMTETFLGREDEALAGDLEKELPSIMRWCLDGLDQLRENGRFTEPESSAGLIEEMHSSASPVREFIAEKCVIGKQFIVSRDQLYNAWLMWCDVTGNRPGNASEFGSSLHAAVPKIETVRPRTRAGKKEKRVRKYAGLGLRSNHEVDQPDSDSGESFGGSSGPGGPGGPDAGQDGDSNTGQEWTGSGPQVDQDPVVHPVVHPGPPKQQGETAGQKGWSTRSTQTAEKVPAIGETGTGSELQGPAAAWLLDVEKASS